MLCVIPARGGSKGIPKKNLRELDGVSLLSRAIEQARAATRVLRVIVSTDDVEIARHATIAGAQVPYLRPDSLAGDEAPARLAYLHLCDWLLTSEGYCPEAFVVLQPTSPLRLPSDIDAAIDVFERTGADAVVSVMESPHPVRWTLTLENGCLHPLFQAEQAIANRQAYATTYVPNGALFVFRTEYLRNHESYYAGRTVPYLMPFERSIDVDREADLELAEFFLARAATAAD